MSNNYYRQIYRYTNNDAYTKASSARFATLCWSIDFKFSNEFSTAISVPFRIQQVRIYLPCNLRLINETTCLFNPFFIFPLYSSPQFSPAISEPRSPWVNPDDEGTTQTGSTTISYNQRSNLKMEADEALGSGATISSVLYANLNHPEWKTEYPGMCNVFFSLLLI